MYKKKKLAKKKHRKNQNRIKALKTAEIAKAKPKKKIASAHVKVDKKDQANKPAAKKTAAKKPATKKTAAKKPATKTKK